MGLLDLFKKNQIEQKQTDEEKRAVQDLKKFTKQFSQAMGMSWNGVWLMNDEDFAIEKNDQFYDVILKDAMLAGLIETRLLVNSTSWEVLPDDDPKDDEERKKINKEGAEMVARIIENIPRWKRFLRIALESRIKGITFQEIIWEPRNGQTEVAYINTKGKNFFGFKREHPPEDERPPQTYRYDNSVIGWYYKGDEGYDITGKYNLNQFENKFFMAIDNETLENPWGRGIGHSIYWTWFYKKVVNKFWLNFMEKFSSPWIIGSTEGAVQQEHLMSILESCANAPIIALPPDCEVKFERVDGTAYQTFQNFIDYCDKKLAIAILGQDLTSSSPGVGASGSYALAKVHSEVRDDIRQSDLDYLNDVINYGTQYSPGLIEMILGVNCTQGIVPRVKFKLTWETQKDKLQQAQLFSTMIQSGMKLEPTRVAQELEIEHLLSKEGEDVLEAPGMGGGMMDMFGGGEDMGAGEEGGFSALPPATFRGPLDTRKVF